MLQFIFGLVITILILFVIGFIFNKLIKRISFFRKNKMLKNIVLVFVSLTIYSLIFSLYFTNLTKIPLLKFDETKWKESISERYKMIDDLLETDYFIGKTKKKIKDIFGDPDEIIVEEDIWVYKLIGRTWADFKITTLKLHFKENTIYKITTE